MAKRNKNPKITTFDFPKDKWKMDIGCVLALKTKLNTNIRGGLEFQEEIDGENLKIILNKHVKGEKVFIGTDYLSYLVKFLKKNKIESISMSVIRDYPIMFTGNKEGKEFKMIVSPRYEE